MKKKLEGVIPAPLTPLTEQGKVDFPLLQKQISWFLQAGINGLFIGGTTGEGAYLTTAEKRDIFTATREVAGGRVPLCLACIQPSTSQVLDELAALEDLEPDFVVAVTPFYYEMPHKAILAHFLQIADGAPVPLVLYNIPQCTHNPIPVETVLELAHAKNIAGLKDSSGDFVSFTRGLLASVPAHFSWIMGEDALDGPALLAGASGIVSGLSNVWVRFHVDLYRAAAAGDREGVRKNQALIDRLYDIHRVTGGKVIPVLKAGAGFFGRCSPRMRIPSLDLSGDDVEAVRRVLEDLQILKISAP
jgi:4-hydroxy-tetrahydrodipicolinate synthase